MFKLSERAPFVNTAAGNSYLFAAGDWSVLPNFSTDGVLQWSPGRGGATIQLLFTGVPAGSWKGNVSCHIGNGTVMLMAGSGINYQPGTNNDEKISTNEFAVDGSGVALVHVVTVGNLDHFSFYSATLEMAE